jgi:hypothetical protein
MFRGRHTLGHARAARILRTACSGACAPSGTTASRATACSASPSCSCASSSHTCSSTSCAARALGDRQGRAKREKGGQCYSCNFVSSCSIRSNSRTKPRFPSARQKPSGRSHKGSYAATIVFHCVSFASEDPPDFSASLELVVLHLLTWERLQPRRDVPTAPRLREASQLLRGFKTAI